MLAQKLLCFDGAIQVIALNNFCLVRRIFPAWRDPACL